MTITVETDRLVLRPFQETDLAFLDRLHSDPLVMQYILGRPRTPDENRVYLETLLRLERERGLGQRLVIRKADNQPVGRCGFSLFYGSDDKGMMSYTISPDDHGPDSAVSEIIELGYTFLREEWGKGYASEAAMSMRTHGHAVQKIAQIHSIIMQENTGSVRVAEKIGSRRLAACKCLGRPGWDYLSEG
ncbi:GNAT family N-acetyltransferase [Paremcibacter congregatus]|jgi:RimJ/RimL family protein N-acetyltransferase|uniref:GNAT family N-acetyltransferase n=1 Tax=Paremcibacter congregatus TaxID=2043170 RepID=UPI0030ECD611|tara:strand:+ start:3616 stop:4182 length:567 start_codon:yes stop_codon:yes gene_type:complete